MKTILPTLFAACLVVVAISSCGRQPAATARNEASKPQAANANNNLYDSNPNQKIEDAPQGDDDKGLDQTMDDMNREGGAHPVNRPK